MKKQQEEREREGIMAFVYPQYTTEELRAFEREMEKYKITKDINGNSCVFYNEVKWYQDNGAMGIFGGIIIDSNPPKYEILRDKLWKMYALQGRREYAQKMNNQEVKQDIQEFTEVVQAKLTGDSDVNPFSVKY